MSYDIAVWKSATPLDAKAATKVYKALDTSDALEKTPALAKFHAALMKRFPPLSDDNEDECPWAADVELGERHVVAPISFSWADDALFEIRELALKHGLDVFDPQKKKVLPPPDPDAKPDPKKRLKADVAVAMLCRGLVAPMKKLGFEVTKREGVPGSVFVRKAKGPDGAFTQEVAFVNLGGRDVTAHMGVRFESVSALIDPILAEWAPARGTVGCFSRGATVAAGSVYFALDLPVKHEYFAGHEICHHECVEESIRAIPAALEKHTLPLFEELDTIAKVDAFYHQAVEKPVRGHDWEELPVSALAVAKLAKRNDIPVWVEHYAKRTAKSADLAKTWASLLVATR